MHLIIAPKIENFYFFLRIVLNWPKIMKINLQVV